MTTLIRTQYPPHYLFRFMFRQNRCLQSEWKSRFLVTNVYKYKAKNETNKAKPAF